MSKANTYKFATGSHEAPRSAVWRVWVQGEEAYVASFMLGGGPKLSIHSNGNWQIQVGPNLSQWKEQR
jgi:hypothetical protein